MKKSLLVVCALISLLVCAGSLPAAAATLWYNGDFNGANGVANEFTNSFTHAAVYDDFIVPAAAGPSIPYGPTTRRISPSPRPTGNPFRRPPAMAVPWWPAAPARPRKPLRGFQLMVITSTPSRWPG